MDPGPFAAELVPYPDAWHVARRLSDLPHLLFLDSAEYHPDRGRYAYVAACTTFAVVDLESGAVVGSTWLPKAKQGKRLVAPAKDVEIVGATAYVAAGRAGAVAIDVSDPKAPKIRGNCTHPEESFWASGVRAEGGKVYVAGGEWGVDTVLDSKSSCGTSVDPPPPPDDVGCCLAYCDLNDPSCTGQNAKCEPPCAARVTWNWAPGISDASHCWDSTGIMLASPAVTSVGTSTAGQTSRRSAVAIDQ